MSDGRYFSPLPGFIGTTITSVVRKFAEEKGLHVESWVHDMPLWLLTSVDSETGMVRRVQVGAYSLGEEDKVRDEVRLIPQVFRFNKQSRVLLAFEESDPKEIRSLPLWEATDVKRLNGLLVETWAAALSLAPPPAVERTNSRVVLPIEVAPEFNL
jgi:hypothetical protein